MELQDLLEQYAAEAKQAEDYVEVDTLALADESVESAFRSVETATSLVIAVDKLSKHFVDSSFSPESLESYRVSIEAALSVAGVGIPASVIVPSFEDGAEVGTAKKEGVFARIMNWIREWMKKISFAIKKFFGIAKTQLLKSKEDLDSIKSGLAKLSDKDKPGNIVPGRVSKVLRKDGKWTVGEGIAEANRNTANTISKFDKIVSEFITSDFKKLPDDKLKAIDEITKSLDGAILLDNRTISVHNGIKFDRTVGFDIHPHDVAAMSVAEIKKSVSEMDAFIELFQKSTQNSSSKLDQISKTINDAETKLGEAAGRFRKATAGLKENRNKDSEKEWVDSVDGLNAVHHLKIGVAVYKELYGFIRDVITDGNFFMRSSLGVISMNLNTYKVYAED